MYKAKLQLRPKSEILYKYVINEIKENKVRIVKQTTLKEGIDVYIDSSKFAFRLAQNFKNKFHGEKKITSSLYGLNRQKGKRIFRLTVLLRLSNPKPL